MERHPCSWIGRPLTIYIFDTIPIKIPMTFFAEIEKPILEFIWNFKGPQMVATIFFFFLKDEIGGLTPPDFKMY